MDRRIVISGVLSFLLVGGAVSLKLAAQETAAHKKKRGDFKRRFEEHQRGVDRRVDVKPKKNGDGIKSGLVVAFGHVINPPYKIDFTNDRLLVNDVVVRPSPTLQREYNKANKSTSSDEAAHAKKISSLMKRAQEIFREKANSVAKVELDKQVLDYVRGQDVVSDAKWISSDQMQVSVRSIDRSTISLVIPFSKDEPIRKSDEEIKMRAGKSQEKSRLALEGRLKRDECVLFTSDGGEMSCGGVRGHKEFKKRISLIMADSKLSQEDKISKLRESFGGDLVPALDISTNYLASEWIDEQR